MSQATISERPYVNSNLFSGHYLDERLQLRDEWECDDEAAEIMDELQSLYELEDRLVEGYNEDSLIDNWIDEVLDTLGFGTQVETSLPETSGFVDILLYESEVTRRDAAGVYLDTQDSIDLFERSVGLVEAKQWDADFTTRFSEQRPYRNASHQIKHYLEQTPENIQWGILTNGRKWRLYGTNDYETQTYYEVDLPELLEKDNLEAFKYFYLFFRPAAFRESVGTTFLNEVWSESETTAQELGEDLQDNVFTALRILGHGFVETNDLNIDSNDEEGLNELKDQSLVLLYRLMFILYAEARGLIHPEGPAAKEEYQENFSLDALRLDIHDSIGEVDEGFDNEFSEYSTSIWNRLEDLFSLIDKGEESLGIPPYNGGLFDHERHAFLTEHEVSNRYLAEVIYRLSTTQNEEERYVLADYADLDTRHLGSVYEGLLEHQFQIAPAQYAAVTEDGGQVWKSADEVTVAEAVETVPEGGLYVVNDEGERKATGAYYTPDYVVTYVVEETVGPLVEDIRQDLVDQGFEPGTQEYLGPFLRRVTDLKILDPAMGSGHFLTRTTGFLAEEVMSEVRDVEVEMGVAFDEQYVRREIAKECIYGVDLNGMAVELAKLSMWLETLAADRPLAFLDHHFKQGNSLVGCDIEEVLSSDNDKETGQLTLTDVFARMRREALEHVMELFQDLLAIENKNLEDIKVMERVYKEIQEDPQYQRLLEMTNVYTAERFGVSVPEDVYEDMAEALRDDTWEQDVIDEDWFKTAQLVADNQKFFHWILEFPSVFYDQDGERKDDAGFDAVIGNPPWLNAWSMTEKMPALRDAIKSLFAETDILSGHWDLYVPFVAKSLELCKSGGKHSFILPNTVLTEKYTRELREDFLKNQSISSILDFGERDVFENVDRQVVVYNVTQSEPAGEHSLRVCRGLSPFSFEEIDRVTSDMWLDVYNYQIRINQNFISDALPLIKKLDKRTTRLGNYLYVNVGATVSSEESGKFSKTDVVSESAKGNAKKFFQGTDVKRWCVNWSGDWLDYRHDEMSGPRTPEMFETEKIALRVRTDEGGVLAAAYDPKGMYCDHTVLVCCNYEAVEGTSATIDFDGFDRIEHSLDLRYLLALINSSLMTWVFKNKFETGGLQGTYSDVWPQSVRAFPIPENSAYEAQLPAWKDHAVRLLSEEDKIVSSDDTGELLSVLADALVQRKEERENINLNLIDYLGDYKEGKSLSELSPIPPEGRGESILAKTDGESERLEKIRATESIVERDGNTLTVKLVPYVKPKEEYEDEYDTNSYGYATLDPIPTMRFQSLDENLAVLIEEFVPYAVKEANGFAGYRDNAISSKSLVKRLNELTLPDQKNVANELEQYREKREHAAKLENQIEEVNQYINEIVYELYGLTDEEIEIVEDAVADD